MLRTNIIPLSSSHEGMNEILCVAFKLLTNIVPKRPGELGIVYSIWDMLKSLEDHLTAIRLLRSDVKSEIIIIQLHAFYSNSQSISRKHAVLI